MVIDPQKTYQATISSDKGDIIIDLDVISATLSVNNFVVLADLGYYDGMPVAFVQDGTYTVFGSPASRPDSDVGYNLDLQPNAQTAKIITGTVAYYPSYNQAKQEVKASGSQFFICLSSAATDSTTTTPLNVFGKLVSGQDVAANLKAGDIINSIKITVK